MKKRIAFVLLSVWTCSAQIVLPEGTKVRVRLDQHISSATALENQIVELSVTDAILVGDSVVIPEGARATGTITQAQEKRRLGRAGKLDFSIDRVKTVDNQWIPIRYLATWAPNVTLRLGDVGVIDNRIFTPVTTLERLGIAFDTRISDGVADYEYVSSDSVTISYKAAGQTPAVGSVLSAAEAGISIRFGAENAVVFHASQCRESNILGLDEVGKQIIARNKKEKWPLNHVVVTALVSAATATVLISAGKDAQVELASAAALSADGLTLAKLETGVRVAHAMNLGTKIVANSSLTPLFHASGLHKAIFRKPDFRLRGHQETHTEDVDPAEVRFAEIDYSDLEQA